MKRSTTGKPKTYPVLGCKLWNRQAFELVRSVRAQLD
jgi:hypothetical protein